jgi:hypothetical protein
VAVTFLESGTAAPPTVNALRSALADGYHLIHFLCHGAATEHGTVLYLEDGAGQVESAQADRLLDAFDLVKEPPLLYSSRLGWRVTGDKAREPGVSIRDQLLDRIPTDN